MIIPLIKESWEAGLENDNYYLKLCGAGGGGFFLGFTRDKKVPNQLGPFKTLIIPNSKII